MAASSTNNSKQVNVAQLMVARLNLIWQMGEASLSAVGNELRIPLQIGKQLHASEIEELERRLSQKFDGAPTWHFEDMKLEALRICVLPDSPATTHTPDSSMGSPGISSPADDSVTAEGVAESSKRTTSKNHKIPRPPNAFILYRQKWHPKIKAGNPTIHNNDISVILGKQWKLEAQSVKQEFKTLAEKIKSQHAMDNPGYQYAPRKASEKKRRMTAKKLARMQENGLLSVSGSPTSINGMLNDVQSEYADLPLGGSNGLTAQAPLPTLEELLGITSHADHNNLPAMDGSDMDFTLPFDSPAGTHNTTTAAAQLRHDPNDDDDDDPAEVDTSTPGHVDATEAFLNSLVNLEAFEGVTWLDPVGVAPMTEVDEIDDQLPHLAPIDPTEYAGYQAESADILNLFP